MLRVLFITLLSIITLTGFSSTKTSVPISHPNSDTLIIAQGDTTEYEILIIETGYENWMATNAKPKWFYTNEYYMNKNQFYVVNWNNRVIETMHKPPYEEMIDYNPTIDYGLDVNYQLFWYFKFIEYKYNINLRGSGRD